MKKRIPMSLQAGLSPETEQLTAALHNERVEIMVSETIACSSDR
jgi:hypothetical protein